VSIGRQAIIRPLFGTILLLLIPGCALPHDIPNDVTVQAFLKPEGNRLLFLVRVPMATMRDTEFPTRGPQGYLDLARTEPLIRDGATLWIGDAIKFYEGDALLPKPRILETRVALISDKSFGSWEQALAHVQGPRLPEETTTFWNQTMLDVLFEYPIQSDHSRFSVDPGGIANLGLRTITVLRFMPPGGAIRAFEYEGDPGLVRLDPRWYQAAGQFVRMGFFHILDGTDHLLFLFCLVVPFRRLRALIPVVTAFTVAHSITLIASAYDYAPSALWFPPLIELLIATSIFYMALENVVVASGEGKSSGERRWLITFAFGLVHGFGFSFALRQTLQFAGNHLLASLLSFNVGVELGQLLVLVLLIPALHLLFRFVVSEKLGIIIMSAIAADIGGHWMAERWNNLARFRFQWPEWNVFFVVGVMRWAAALIVLAGLLWLLRDLPARFRRAEDPR
jgi:hypothetical protein